MIFYRIYAEQDAGHAFTTIDRLLAAMSPKFVDASKESIKDHLTKRFYSEEFIDKLVMAGMRVNYGQTNDIHAFVGRSPWLLCLKCRESLRQINLARIKVNTQVG